MACRDGSAARAPDIIYRLAARRAIAERVIIVVAHPDDETIGIGAQLSRLGDALLVHVTDGAPRDGRDARSHGCASVAEYAARGRAELAAALAAGGAGPIRRLGFDCVDQEAAWMLPALIERIALLLRSERPQAVFTHSYEGGHPDHDAAALAVHASCRLMAGAGLPVPAIIEMALYHRRGGRLVRGGFVPAGRAVTTIALDREECRRKRRMVAAFATQSAVLADFDLAAERFRSAPDYDFGRPPHPGELHYETLGWGVTGDDWRRAAAAALARLGLSR